MLAVPKKSLKNGVFLILPVLLGVGIFFCAASVVLNIPDYLDSISTKVSFPSSFEFKTWDAVLKKHVRHGLVDYAALKNSPELAAAYQDLKENSPEKLQGKLEQLSFWINAYNLLTIKCIADKYPITELRSDPAKRKFNIGGKLYSLVQIKDEVLPPLIKSSDWRAIFLLCDGQISCPEIADHAYSPSKLSDEFPEAMRRFVLSKANYRIDEKFQRFSVSPYYQRNIRFIDDAYASPFDMVNSMLPRKLELESINRDYGMPYDFHINDVAWLKRLGIDQAAYDKRSGQTSSAAAGSESPNTK